MQYRFSPAASLPGDAYLYPIVSSSKDAWARYRTLYSYGFGYPGLLDDDAFLKKT